MKFNYIFGYKLYNNKFKIVQRKTYKEILQQKLIIHEFAKVKTVIWYSPILLKKC